MHSKIDSDLLRNYHNFVLRRLKFKNRRKPTFIGIGEGRCGTTSIANWLSNHPDVYMSPIKEIKYFSQTARFITKSGITFEEYLSYFSLASNAKHIGEISPQYISSAIALEKMAEFLPNLKVIVTIRNPLDRFISLFKYHKEYHGYNSLDEYVQDAFKYLEEPARPFHCPSRNLKRSLYSESIERVFSLFGQDQVLVLMYEELVEDSEYYKNKLMTFLELEDNEQPFPRVNASGVGDVVPDYIQKQIYEYCSSDINKLMELGVELPKKFYTS